MEESTKLQNLQEIKKQLRRDNTQPDQNQQMMLRSNEAQPDQNQQMSLRSDQKKTLSSKI